MTIKLKNGNILKNKAGNISTCCCSSPTPCTCPSNCDACGTQTASVEFSAYAPGNYSAEMTYFGNCFWQISWQPVFGPSYSFSLFCYGTNEWTITGYIDYNNVSVTFAGDFKPCQGCPPKGVYTLNCVNNCGSNFWGVITITLT